MKILYLSCHAILEYDEIKLLAELGHTVHSIGSYTNPQSPGDPKRPPIIHANLPVDLQHIDISNRFHQDNLHDEHLEWADVVLFMHDPDHWISKQVDKFKKYNKPVIYRSIGQSSPTIEQYLVGLKNELGALFHIIRYSNNESFIAYNEPLRPELYCPYFCDALIPFYKDSREITNSWTNTERDTNILFVTQSATQRGSHCHFDELEAATANFDNRVLVGPNNEDWARDNLTVVCPSYKRLLEYYTSSKLFVYSGTVPASYTLAPIEAMASGIPIITISKEWWDRTHEGWINKKVFEVPEFFPGQIAFSPDMLEKMCKMALESEEILQLMSKNSSQVYEERFSEKIVGPLWTNFLNKL